MEVYKLSNSVVTTLKERWQKLAQLVKFPVLIWSGKLLSRNFPANKFPFRASSHFLYFTALPLANAVIRLEDGKLELFMDDPEPGNALWHGETPTRSEIAYYLHADENYTLKQLPSKADGAATIAVQDLHTYQQQCQILGREVSLPPQATGMDLELAKAIITLRLHHDTEAISQLRQAATVTVAAHQAGMRNTMDAKTEAEIRGAMEEVIIAHNMSCAYTSIVTIQGEVLHNGQYHNSLQPGDLLLADMGAETPGGWAADVTRTWPVRGKFSPTQKDIYEVVLAAHDTCIAKVYPGIDFQDLHLLAASIIAEGLVELGILRGQVEDLVAQDAHALFFPHGLGHLLGLDVHDMEDLGDLAGYELGKIRSNRFGLGFLRLNRILRPGMLVTIEPGFYQVPGILKDPDRRAKYQNMVNWERLEQFADVRGIRIEDDVLVTPSGCEVITATLPSTVEAVEATVQGK